MSSKRYGWRPIVIRDHFTCQRCGAPGCDVAHILPRGRYPELRADAKNMLVLCRKCHNATENVAGRRELIKLMEDRGFTYEEKQYQPYKETDAREASVDDENRTESDVQAPDAGLPHVQPESGNRDDDR